MSGAPQPRHRTSTHPLLPASRPGSTYEHTPRVPTYSLLTWTFGRGSVIWRIWPAVALHTAFAAVIVTLSMRKIVNLEIPTVMLTVLGVVIGFVISYRAISGYERYWLGRGCWSDVMRNCRSLGRLVWFHVPLRTTPKTPEEIQSGESQRSVEELNKIMTEKRMALDLIEGFAVSLKHHIRGELGIYYEDLYHLVRPMHDHIHDADHTRNEEVVVSPRKGQRITTKTNINQRTPPPASPIMQAQLIDADPVIPAINDYGTFDASKLSASEANTRGHHALRRSPSSLSSTSTVSQPLLPSQTPASTNVMTKVSRDLIPFAGAISTLKNWFKRKNSGGQVQISESSEQTSGALSHGRKWRGPIHSGAHVKHHPVYHGDGENLPLEILRCLSEWFSVLEDRGTVPGTSLGAMIGTITAFEESLTSLERILTTPLPFVYSVHIRHTVWIYLFFLPFQLVSQFGYYTIPGVALASFIYLGFIAAGEEIEQPFGYDDNDLDLDLFCREIIHADLKHLKISPCLNAYFGPDYKQPVSDARPVAMTRRSLTLTEMTALEDKAGMSSFSPI
ncbi:Bestrophin, RFP-TM, chloride channel-domain-containing protein [Panaeolus papilionaceus]|nr:Bestrophin, RFP-TM, chloride channel-domain-containing protein [Panaeolus papilionaceus]